MKKLSAILLLLLSAAALRAQDSVTTLAGQALVSGAVNGTGTNALFSDPAAIIADANGNFFVADSQNDAIREVTTNGVVTTFAGRLGRGRKPERHWHQRAVRCAQRTGV